MNKEELTEHTRQIEAFEDGAGWDSIPALYVFKQGGDLDIFALATPSIIEPLKLLDPIEGVEAVILSTEGWMYPPALYEEFDSKESLLAFARRNPPESHPQRQEVRQVVGMTPEHEIQVKRVRGEEPEVVQVASPIQGDLAEELRRLVGRT